MAENRNYPPITPSTYKVALSAETNFEFVSAFTVFPYTILSGETVLPGGYVSGEYTQQVYENNELIFSNRYTYYHNSTVTKFEGDDIGVTLLLKNNADYKVIYIFEHSYSMTVSGTPESFTNRVTYTFATVENKLPLKKWTVTSVINRLLDLCEPLRRGEKPRFRLNGMGEDGSIIPEGQEGSGQAAKFDKILAPQFSLTRQTLRECLQEVGKVIHGEPRLRVKKDSAGEYYYEVIYDMYASQEGSDIYYKPYLNKGLEWVINNYQTWVDSNAENLINQLDKLSGVIVEPYNNGAKSVRTENQYVRIEEGNMLIATQYPIYTVDKLEYVYTDGSEVKSVDITPYVFEKSEYDTRLSSYREQFPYSKAYGLYFSQGSKNIGGLNFKVEAASFEAFKNYAIVNILKQVIGSGYSLPAYPLLAFRVTYTPYYNVRVAQTKTNYKDFKFPAALIYNQQSNVIESRYYGENLKGVTARLGNVEKSLMYRFKTLKKVPKAGQLFGKDYYISAVATEILPTYIRCTVGLSKDFNRISAYIGVPSEKRYYEISQQQAIDRNVLWREYVVVGDREQVNTDGKLLIGPFMVRLLMNTFNGGSGAVPTRVRARGMSYQGNDLPAVSLPIISSAFGNSISFSWRYEDNYSAGAISQKVENSLSGGVTGYWQNDARYCDYYGRLYYYYFDITFGSGYTEKVSLELPEDTNPPTESFAKYISNLESEPFILRKDNREALQINYQIDFVTNTDIIIGSALAAYCPAVRNGRYQYGKARLYVFPTELHKFTDHIEGWENVELEKMPYVEVTAESFPGGFAVNAPSYPASGKSWAIVIPQQKGEAEQVEDEQGNQYEYEETFGGDMLIGQNKEVTAGQAFTPVYFTPKREIFDKSVWVDVL